MNPVTFNDRFMKLLKFRDAQTQPDEVISMAESPLVQWDEPTEQDFDLKNFPESFFPNQCPRLPFERFRVDGFYHYLGEGFMKFRAWIRQVGLRSHNPGFALVMQIEKTNEGVYDDLIGESLIEATADYTGEFTSTNQPVVLWQFGHIDMNGNNLPSVHKMGGEQIWGMCAEWVQKLCMDFYNPHLFLCKKHPKLPQGKSVNWIKQREHFVLLHKSHAANSVEQIGKKTIHDASERNRVSHSRRAHFRLLSSPKFKHKRGQRVWVSSSWVGPKEWTDRSGQIYKIVDRKITQPHE